MPDWRKAEDYAYTATLTLHQWAWEFLRRNTDYRKDWESFQARVASGELTRDPNEHGERSAHTANIRLASRWDLYILSDPFIAAHEMQHSPDFRYTTDVMVHHGWTGQGTVRDGVEWLHGGFNPALIFNILIPIDAQLEVARKLLLYFRKRLVSSSDRVRQRKGKPQPSKFPLYIRTMDGRLAGVSEGKIGQALFKGYEPRLKARQALKAARKIASSGYRDLLLTPDTWTRLDPTSKAPLVL